MKTYQRVFAKINLNHLEYNLEEMHRLVGCKSKFFCVLKTDGYGHGAVPAARLLEHKPYVYGYAVATVEEAVELRKSNIKKPILVLGYTFPDSYPVLAQYDIMPTVFREDMLKQLSFAAKESGKHISVHVKVDTGMGRIGITPDEEGLCFVDKVLHTEGLQLEGMFTHFAKADEIDKSFSAVQLEKFLAFTDAAERQHGICIPYKHCANSAGIMELPDSYLELVRAGISLYGMYPSEEVNKELLDLKPVMSLYSHIVFLKDVPAGTQISYGGTFEANKPMRIATIPVGYGDGYPRGLSNKGYVLIHGKKAPVLGRVCMDQLMVDVTEIPEAALNDLVTIIGEDGEACVSMEILGLLCDRLHYEIACDIGKRVPRIYEYHGEIIEVKDFYM